MGIAAVDSGLLQVCLDLENQKLIRVQIPLSRSLARAKLIPREIERWLCRAIPPVV